MDRTPPFVVVRTSLLSLMICLCLACSSRQDAGAPCPIIEISAVADSQTNATGAPLVAPGDITGATASEAGEHWVLHFTVTDAAATRVRDFTAQNVGRQLAIVADGQVKGTPRIAAAVVGNSYQIGDLTRADAEQLASAISNGCRR